MQASSLRDATACQGRLPRQKKAGDWGAIAPSYSPSSIPGFLIKGMSVGWQRKRLTLSIGSGQNSCPPRGSHGLKEKGSPMPKKKRRAKGKLTETQLLAESRKVLRQAERTLETELKEVKRYRKALDGWSSFNVPWGGKR
jgi:hypothetical protein